MGDSHVSGGAHPKSDGSTGEACRKGTQVFAIQTFSGKESLLVLYIQKIIPEDIYAEVFVPKRTVLRRLGGRWTEIIETVFPGYVFIRTATPDQLFFSLKNVPSLSVLLHDSEFTFVTVDREEQDFMRLFTPEGNYSIGLSHISAEKAPGEKEHHHKDPTIYYHREEIIRILDGPLKELTGKIVGFDLHKRKAMVQTNFFGGKVVHVGIEIIAKTDKEEKQEKQDIEERSENR